MRSSKVFYAPRENGIIVKNGIKVQLDAIEAPMSGGGGGSGSLGFVYTWDENPSVYETSSDVAGFAIGLVAGIIVTVATKNATVGKAIAGTIAAAIAEKVVSEAIGVVYYRVYEYLLRAQPKNPYAGVGFVAGQVVVTEYYKDQTRKTPLSGPSMYSNVSSSLAGLEQSCPGYSLL